MAVNSPAAVQSMVQQDITAKQYNYLASSDSAGSSVSADGTVVVASSQKSQGSTTSQSDEKDTAEAEERARNAVDKIMQQLAGERTSVSFKVHEGTGRIMIQVLDEDTKKVVREVPPETILDSIAELWKLSGLKVDKSV